jgi:hypothetical protein
MRFSDYSKLVVVGLSVMVLSACGTCPNLRYAGPMKNEDLAFLRERVAKKEVDLNAEEVVTRGLASNFVFVPLYLGARNVLTHKGSSNVTNTGRTGGPYRYTDLDAIGFPLTVWYDQVVKSYSEGGEELSHGSYKGLFAGLLGSGGSFRYKSRERVPAKMISTNIFTGLGIIPAFFSPSRWYFTGTNGYYWNAPLWLFGHISSDTSSAFHLLGLIPIRYKNKEKSGKL